MCSSSRRAAIRAPNTQQYGIANLKAGLAFADDAHVTILRDSSNKEPAQL